MAERVEVEITATDKASGAVAGLTGALGTLGSVAAAAGQALALALGAGLALVGTGLKIAVEEALEAEENIAQLDAVLKSTGEAAGVTKDMALELADSFSQVTKFSDDAILAGENMLLTFTNIGADVFPLATEAMLDLSQAMGQDIKSSAIQLGKALNNPIEGITALTRVGVTFTDAQKEMIKSLQEAGDVAGAQKIILDELNKEFGGSAEAAGQTAAGQFEIFKNKLLEIGETAGNILLPAIGEIVKAIGPDVEAALLATLPLVQQFADLIRTIVLLAEGGADPLTLLRVALANVLPPETFTQLQKFTTDLQTMFGPTFQNIGTQLGELGAQIATFWDANGTQILDAIAFTFGAIAGIVSAAIQIVLGIVTAFFALLNGDTAAAGQALNTAFAGAWGSIKSIFSDGANTTVGVITGLVSQIGIIIGKLTTILPEAIGQAIAAGIAKAKEAIRIGQGIVDGIVSAITAGAASIIGALVGAVQEAIAAAQGAIQSQSPSKVTANLIGGPMAQGIGVGIAQNAGVPAQALVGATMGAIGAAAGVANTTNRIGFFGPSTFSVTGGPGGLDSLMNDIALQASVGPAG